MGRRTGVIAAVVLALLASSATAAGPPFEVQVGEPTQTPLEPGVTQGRLTISTHHDFQPGANYLATLQEPNGAKTSQHGLLDNDGTGEIVFLINRPGLYTMHVSVISGGRTEHGQVTFRANVEAQPALLIIDGPGAGAVLRSKGRVTAMPIAIAPPAPNEYPGIATASGTVNGPGAKCKDASFHGTLYGKPDPGRGCGWGKVVYWSDATAVMKLLASSTTNTSLALEELTKSGGRGGALAFRAIESTVLSAVIQDVQNEIDSERLERSSGNHMLEKLNKARDGINRIFTPLRSMLGGQGSPALVHQLIAVLAAVVAEENYVVERLDARHLALSSDAPEFEAFSVGRFSGTGTNLTLSITVATSPSQDGLRYHLEVTKPDGRKEQKAGTISKGLVSFKVPVSKLGIFELTGTVVGAQPFSGEYSTGRSCPGGTQTQVFHISPPVGSTGPVDVPVTANIEIVPCDTPTGKPHAAPVIKFLTSPNGGHLALKDFKADGPNANLLRKGNWNYAYSGTATISSDTAYYYVATWH